MRLSSRKEPEELEWKLPCGVCINDTSRTEKPNTCINQTELLCTDNGSPRFRAKSATSDKLCWCIWAFSFFPNKTRVRIAVCAGEWLLDVDRKLGAE